MPAWGKQSPRLPVTEVRPGHLEFAVLQQDQVRLGGINLYIDTAKFLKVLQASVPIFVRRQL